MAYHRGLGGGGWFNPPCGLPIFLFSQKTNKQTPQHKQTNKQKRRRDKGYSKQCLWGVGGGGLPTPTPTHTNTPTHRVNTGKRGPPIVPLLFIHFRNTSHMFCTRLANGGLFPTGDPIVPFVISPRFECLNKLIYHPPRHSCKNEFRNII